MRRNIAATISMLLVVLHLSALAQTGAAYGQSPQELRGTIVDEQGAFIVAAPIILDDGKGQKYTATTNEQGRYRFPAVLPGVYTVTVELEGFAKYEEQLDLTQKRATPFDISLNVFISDMVEVRTDTAGISTDPDKNLSAVTLTAQDLEALPDDPDELLETLRQMAGAAGGTGEASVYVGGFRERGRIPSKDSIQMVRINSNPFSAEFSETGFSRIEIVTKPGSDTYHGGFNFRFNDDFLNARNASAITKAPLQSRNYGGNFSGPIIRNRWGFFFDMDRREVDENDVVNAITLDRTTLLATPFVTTVLTPLRGLNFSLRTDFLATKKHTLGFQYRYSDNEWLNQGLNSSFDLPERAFTRNSHDDNFRFSLTSIVSENAVNEMRWQYARRTTESRALIDAPALIVRDAFSAGGNQSALFTDNSDTELEFSNDLTYTYKKHTIKTGFRAEGERLENFSRANFGGTFTFASLDQYRRVLRGEAGATPQQFSITAGDPFIDFTQWEMGWFIQDDWKISQQLTLSYGLRHEFQTNLQDKINFAPRFGLAWADKGRKNTIRGGGGIFYNRLDDNITYDTIRLDGERQQQFTVLNPTFFPNIPTPDQLVAGRRLPTIRTKAEDLNAPYSMLSTISYERQLPHNLFASVGYTWQRGVHLLRTRNINAPIREGGTAVKPFPDQGPILQYESTGFSNRHELRTTLRAQINPRVSIWGSYGLSSTRSDTDGAGSSPANPYNLFNEYGRSSMDSRHQIHFGGNATLPWNVRVTGFGTGYSSRPLNITTPFDVNGDTILNDRPAFGNPGDPNVVVTRFGAFKLNPGPADLIIPRNFGEGPGFFTASLNVSKTFGFGTPVNSNWPNRAAAPNTQNANSPNAANQGGQGNQRGQNQGGNRQGGNRQGGPGGGFGGGNRVGGPGGFGGGGRMGGGGGFFGDSGRNKYNITVGVNIMNLFNAVNYAQYSGLLGSPFFGVANRAQESRRISTFVRFSF